MLQYISTIANINRRWEKAILLPSLFVFVMQTSCRKLVEVNPPVTSSTSASVYNSDATAAAVLTGMYAKLSSTSNYSGNHGFTTISLFAGLSADEFTLFDLANSNYLAYYANRLSISSGGFEYWSPIYSYLFACNSALEGINSSSNLTPGVKQQLLGEAKFLRAFFYFYLINMYGDAPLVMSSDYKINAMLPRTTKAQIYQQIIADLKDARSFLASNYVDGTLLKKTAERTRPNKWAATALLARAYLYTGDWANAEAQATSVIDNSSLYGLATLNNAFLRNSNEAIWQLQPVTPNISNTQDAYQFIIPATGPSSSWPVYLSDNLLKNFEAGDLRRTNWIDSVVIAGSTYFYPYKYKVIAPSAPVTEYLMMLRLGEQYLIRSEARVQEGKVDAGAADLNSIRARAGLPYTTAATQPTLLSAIQHERQVELFTELGHRWFDLKRTLAIDTVMNVVTPKKGGSSWNSYQQLYPIYAQDIQKDINLTQNPGYQ